MIIIFKAQIVKLSDTIVEIAWWVFGVRWVPIKGLLFFTSLHSHSSNFIHSLTFFLANSQSCSAMAVTEEEQVSALKQKLWELIESIVDSDDYTVHAADKAIHVFLPLRIWSAPLLTQPTWIMHPFLHTFDARSLVTWWQILLSWPLDRFSFFPNQDSIFLHWHVSRTYFIYKKEREKHINTPDII